MTVAAMEAVALRRAPGPRLGPSDPVLQGTEADRGRAVGHLGRWRPGLPGRRGQADGQGPDG